jgi:hypothetical protein
MKVKLWCNYTTKFKPILNRMAEKPENIFSDGGGAETFCIVALTPPFPCAGDTKELPKIAMKTS